jgi:hypothetical protein
MRNIFISSLAAFALTGCVTIGPEPVVTKAEREEIYTAFNDTSSCRSRILAKFPVYGEESLSRDCECIRREFADQMAPWMIRMMIDANRGKDTPQTPAMEARVENEIRRLVPAAYRSCGVAY